MLALDPSCRYQTATQLHAAVREVRAELNGGSQAEAPPPTVYVVESKLRFQEVLRRKLKRAGYRVLLAADPQRAVERFDQYGFDALVLNAMTSPEAGLRALRHICSRAQSAGQDIAVFVLLAEGQKDVRRTLESDPVLCGAVSMLFLPLSGRELLRRLRTAVPPAPLPGRKGESHLTSKPGKGSMKSG
jgi:DNA-binding response OmpR family regulator